MGDIEHYFEIKFGGVKIITTFTVSNKNNSLKQLTMKKLLTILTLVIVPMLSIAQSVGDSVTVMLDDGEHQMYAFYVDNTTVLAVVEHLGAGSPAWGCTSIAINPLSVNIGDGISNYNEISSACPSMPYATWDFFNTIYTFPTLLEAYQIYIQLHLNGIGNFNGQYWLSYIDPTNAANDEAAYLDFDNFGMLGYDDRTNPNPSQSSGYNNNLGVRAFTFIEWDALNMVTGENQLIIDNPEPTIYPNPTNGTVNIKCEDATGYKVFDTQGRLIASDGIISTLTTVDLSDLIGGVYVIELTSESGKYVERVIKQ